MAWSQNQPVTISVTGTVREKATGAAIPGALVRGHVVVWQYQGPDLFERCPYQQVTADAQGRYQLTFITPLSTSGSGSGRDGLCVYASAPGYETVPQYARSKITAGNCAFTNFNFDLGPGKKLTGVVLDAAGKPVPDAHLRVQSGWNGDWDFFGALGTTSTRPDGSFELWTGTAESEQPGKHAWLSAVKHGAGTHVAWNIMTREDLGVLRLNPGGDITGRVADGDGVPVAGCEVSVRRYPFDVVATARTDKEGRYHLRSVPGEPGIIEFFKQKNGRYDTNWGTVEVYARVNPATDLKFAPHHQVIPKDGQVIPCPDLALALGAEVSGALLSSKTALGRGGLLVRLDSKWEDMVEVDINGRFRFPFVSPGKHRLTAYLPYNLRYDRGIGSAEIEVQPGQRLEDVQIQLADLAELRVQYLDDKGNPLPGITASATWSRSGDGAWTEGTVSDQDGWAVLYLYPEGPQYVRGVHQLNALAAETAREVQPLAGQVMVPVQVVMLPVATVTGRLVNEKSQSFANQRALSRIHYADGTVLGRPLQTDARGQFRLEGMTPGIATLSLELDDTVFPNPLGKSLQVRPGETQAVGDLVLKNGLNRAREIKTRHAQAMQHPEEVRKAAAELFRKIQGADYDSFLKPGADWGRFPIVGHYQTFKWFDVLVQHMSTTFKTNPIVTVELGQPYPSSRTFNGQKGLPTVPYKATLKDGSVLKGDLPFEYNFDGGNGHWHGIEGIDWHLQKPSAPVPAS